MTYVTSMRTMMFRANQRGAQRRLSELAAYRDAARAYVLERRPCDCSEGTDLWSDDGQTCLFHDGAYAKLIERVARLMRRTDTRERIRLKLRDHQAEIANTLAMAAEVGLDVEEMRVC